MQMLRPWDLPEPYRPLRPRRRIVKKMLAAAATLGAVVAAFTLPLPQFFAYLPGPVRDTLELVHVSGATTYTSDGRLLLTTVSVDTQLTFADLVAAIVDRNKDVVPAEQVTQGQSLREAQRQQSLQMQLSKQAAREVVLTALGLVDVEGGGARVEGTEPDSPADRVLAPGDVIVAVDGVEIETTCDVGRALNQHEPRDAVALTVRRDGVLRRVEVVATVSPIDGVSAFLGVQMSDIDKRFEPGFSIRFETGEIGGPSAGLMFALALYDKLTPGDLTSGRTIAGTGEIQCDGGVTPIGGIEEKIAGAVRAGADYFLAPAANVAAAEAAAPGDITIVSVVTFEDAIEFLEGLA